MDQYIECDTCEERYPLEEANRWLVETANGTVLCIGGCSGQRSDEGRQPITQLDAITELAGKIKPYQLSSRHRSILSGVQASLETIVKGLERK